MAVKITYFVHGTTTDNEKDIATGWLPGELSELGVKQSEELSNRILKKRFDVVFCSDLKRAVDSARIIFGSRYKIIRDKRLRECDYGNLTGKPASEVKKRMKEHIEKKFLGGESYKDVERRVSSFLESLKQNYNGKKIAVVAHQAPQLAMDVLIRNITWSQAIDEDWRNKKEWRPGWEYFLS
jgi:broad specificity phosphatase PhoE